MIISQDTLVDGEVYKGFQLRGNYIPTWDYVHPSWDYVLGVKNFMNDMQQVLQNHFIAVCRPNSTEYGDIRDHIKFLWYRDLKDTKGNYDLLLELHQDHLKLVKYEIIHRSATHVEPKDIKRWEYNDPNLFEDVEVVLRKAKGDFK